MLSRNCATPDVVCHNTTSQLTWTTSMKYFCFCVKFFLKQYIKQFRNTPFCRNQQKWLDDFNWIFFIVFHTTRSIFAKNVGKDCCVCPCTKITHLHSMSLSFKHSEEMIVKYYGLLFDISYYNNHCIHTRLQPFGNAKFTYRDRHLNKTPLTYKYEQGLLAIHDCTL